MPWIHMHSLSSARWDAIHLHVRRQQENVLYTHIQIAYSTIGIILIALECPFK